MVEKPLGTTTREKRENREKREIHTFDRGNRVWPWKSGMAVEKKTSTRKI